MTFNEARLKMNTFFFYFFIETIRLNTRVVMCVYIHKYCLSINYLEITSSLVISKKWVKLFLFERVIAIEISSMGIIIKKNTLYQIP